VFWDGVHVAGPVESLFSTPSSGPSSVYGFWARWPAGMVEPDGDATGILRTGLIQPIDVTLERTRVSLGWEFSGVAAGLSGQVVAGI
jgi:hypothetical protein